MPSCVYLNVCRRTLYPVVLTNLLRPAHLCPPIVWSACQVHTRILFTTVFVYLLVLSTHAHTFVCPVCDKRGITFHFSCAAWPLSTRPRQPFGPLYTCPLARVKHTLRWINKIYRSPCRSAPTSQNICSTLKSSTHAHMSNSNVVNACVCVCARPGESHMRVHSGHGRGK
jgi:hypothetical protein